MGNCRICLIEDDEVMGGALALRFDLEGYEYDWHTSGKAALAALQKQSYAAVVSDIRLPDLSGEALYASLLDKGMQVPPFIFITGHGAVDQAVRLLKLGAVDYLLKPFEPDLLLGKLRALNACAAGAAPGGEALGISPAILSLAELLPRMAHSQATVLISGESGVGKEVVTRRLHDLRGDGRQRPFVAVNCASFTESLLEAELFGYEKGAFTGAVRARHGLFEQAQGGTLFLDEIGDMPPSMQVKLLRVIQERQLQRVGGETPIPVDVRLIAATHLDLKALVEQGRFREDLYYRVNVIQLRVPPLRERREDILWLAGRFLEQFANGREGQRKLLAPAAERALLDYPWPGNVRELRHVLERACVLAEGPILTPELLFDGAAGNATPPPSDTLGDYLAGRERDYILRALESQSWQIQETANLLGISRKNLWEKMKRLGIERA
ncbi:MAG TPA: sigma-54 dependent transcriptional regulator [Thiobacillaceae bacterium]|nr:sigma-54 dependent transcriptional regulator [Thiobacillaceae bacterium]